MNKLNKNNQRHGYWEKYYYNGKLNYKGYYLNGEHNGYWVMYYPNGKLYFKGYFINGKPNGYWECYNQYVFKSL